jgi:aerobic carbon-monoxide dehydrogenase small subunit
MKVLIKINGTVKNVEVETDEKLVDTLRNRLNLTGTKKSCGAGECGVCTVLLDGHTVNSCLIYTWQAVDHEIITIEGLSSSNEMNALQKAFIKEGAVHCGYCTPGIILSLQELNNAKPGTIKIRELIKGNLCSCTGYRQILNAVSSIYGEENE